MHLHPRGTEPRRDFDNLLATRRLYATDSVRRVKVVESRDNVSVNLLDSGSPSCVEAFGWNLVLLLNLGGLHE
jgi:hypothetical protein